jgi:hypothetical protein
MIFDKTLIRGIGFLKTEVLIDVLRSRLPDTVIYIIKHKAVYPREERVNTEHIQEDQEPVWTSQECRSRSIQDIHQPSY